MYVFTLIQAVKAAWQPLNIQLPQYEAQAFRSIPESL